MASQGKSYLWHKTLRFVVLVFLINLALRYVDQQSLSQSDENGLRATAALSVAAEAESLGVDKANQGIILGSAFPGLDTRKRFALIMQRMVGEENRALQWQQRRLVHINPRDVSFSDRVWLQSLAHEYGIDCAEPCDALEIYTPLLESVNQVPLSGLLPAAAVSSRFGADISAQRHRNLFVLWQRMAPPRYRAEGVYPWRSFISWRHSVRAFIHFINTDSSFAAFRASRLQHDSETQQLALLREALLASVPEKAGAWKRVEKGLLTQ